MEVGESVTYLDPNGIAHNALVAKASESLANIVVISTDGADDHFGKNRQELRDVLIGSNPGCCMSNLAAAKRAKRIAEEEDARIAAEEEAARVAEAEAERAKKLAEEEAANLAAEVAAKAKKQK